MKVTILTVVYNGEQTIEDTITSVIGQDYKDIEYIIVDGKSTDKTLDIVNKYSDRITKIISEKDKGIYDAMNKGLSLATGDVIGILNADDVYSNSTIVSSVVNLFLNSNSDAVYGDLVYVDRYNLNKVTRNWKAGLYTRRSFLYGWMPPHPTLFVKKGVYESHGTFDTRLRTAADYEIMLRFLYKENIFSAYLPQVIVKMRSGGVSNSSIKNRIAANKEDRLAWKMNGLKPFFFTLWFKPLRKVAQFIFR